MEELEVNTEILGKKVLADILEFNEYVRNKRIVIVGPSTSLKNRNLGPFFDSFDIIVKLNKSLHMKSDPKDYGSRLDVLYNNMCYYEKGNELDTKYFEKYNTKYLVSSYPMISPFKKDIVSYLAYAKGRIPVVIPSVESYMGLISQLNGSRPYTGMCAIWHLLTLPIKSLHVYGCDFYISSFGYSNSYKQDRKVQNIAENSIHSASKHQYFLKHSLLKTPKLHYDPNIIELLFLEENNWTKNVININDKLEFFTDNKPQLNSQRIWLSCSNKNINAINNGDIWTYWDGLNGEPIDIEHKLKKGIQIICPYSCNHNIWTTANNSKNINVHILWEIDRLNPWLKKLNEIEKLVFVLLKYSKKGQLHLFSDEINTTWLNYLSLMNYIVVINYK